MTVGALNVANFDYFTQVKPFRDLMKSASYWAGNPSEQDTDGWLRGMVSGGTARTKIIHQSTVEHATAYSNIRTGVYFVTWEGPCTVTVDSGTGITNRSLVSANRYTYELTSEQTPLVILRCANTSGSNADLTVCRVFHEDDEEALDAGEIFEPSFLASLGGASVLRFMDWMNQFFGFGTESMTEVNFSDWPTEAWCTWAPDGRYRNGCPPTVMAKLCRKLRVRPYLTFPAKCTKACMQSFLQAVKDEWNVKPYLSYNNESHWNTAFPFSQTGNWLSATKAAGDDFDGDGNNLTIYDGDGEIVDFASASAGQKRVAAMAHGAGQLWEAAEVVYGSGGFYRALEGQAANFDAVKPAFHYIYNGTAIKDMLVAGDIYAIAPYWFFKTGGNITNITLKWANENRASLTTAWFTEAIGNSITNEATVWVAASKSALAAIAPSCSLSSYELGDHTTHWLPEIDASGYAFTIEEGVLRSATDISGAFATGEGVYPHFSVATLSSELSGAQRELFFRVINTTDCSVHPTAADAEANTNAYTLDGVASSYKFDNYTGVVLLDVARRAYLDSADGRASMVAHIAACADLEHYTQFHSSGGYGYGVGWGLKRSQWDADADYPRALEFRDFTVVNVDETVSDGLSGAGSGKRSKKRKWTEDEIWEYVNSLKAAFKKPVEASPKVEQRAEEIKETALELIEEVKELKQEKLPSLKSVTDLISRIEKQAKKYEALLEKEQQEHEEEEEAIQVLLLN